MDGIDIEWIRERAKNDWLVVITVYIPKPPKWIDPKTRGGHEK